MALIGGLLAATALVGVVPAGAVTLWAPTTACGVFDTTTVPAGVTSMTIKVEGARAGAAGSGTSSGTEKSDPGFGGKVTATVAVAPGATISAVVGCQGGNFPSSNCGGNPTRPASSAGWSKGRRGFQRRVRWRYLLGTRPVYGRGRRGRRRKRRTGQVLRCCSSRPRR